MRHQLKSWQPYFDHVATGQKTFDVRFDDRGYQVGHEVELLEWQHLADKPTGRRLIRHIVYVLDGAQDGFGLQRGFVVLGLS
jgi:hypothetical protein